MKKRTLKSFRITERGTEGRILVRTVQVEGFDQIEIGWRTIAIDETNPITGDIIQAVWPRSEEDV